ncbi:N-acetylglucosamine-6-phosphate deacetylase [Poseidonocella sp. HB161398]|uniref:N-acetylglucosamine-6-phosphate deacetylase n=1 Tax=Poseidonocella sp. HB161398 TaxID=2320855 RepID=UPI0011082C42|nr:N-acetylglucosamine-6-phosphate deacetylase [Poseidonocella sp. HB161398]
MTRRILAGGPVFDGTRLIPEGWVAVEAGRIAAIGDGPLPAGERLDLAGGILSPGFVDLQVNGGGGRQFNDDPSTGTLAVMAAAHRRLGSTSILPTLITDSPDITRRAIAAVGEAVAAGIEGIAGLHLEGPHLALSRKGAHDPALIRPMEDADLELYCRAAAELPALLVTLAPESASEAQVARLVAAGAVVSLGHSDADYDTACRYAAAGARMATHLFNAMSQLGHRAPGLAGAALSLPELSAGIIADGVHVHPQMLRLAFAAKQGPGTLFLVTDAMAPAGTGEAGFTLNGRWIARRDGRLTLADGTLAGADLQMVHAVGRLVREAGLPPGAALAAATRLPAAQIPALAGRGTLRVGAPAELIRIEPDFSAAAPLP